MPIRSFLLGISLGLIMPASSYAQTVKQAPKELFENLKLVRILDRDSEKRVDGGFTDQNDYFAVTQNVTTRGYSYSFVIGGILNQFSPCAGSSYSYRSSLSRNSRYLAVSCEDNMVEAWDLETTKLLTRFPFGITNNWKKVWVQISNDGTRLLAGARFRGEIVELWDIENGRKIKDLTSEVNVCANCSGTVDRTVVDFEFSPDFEIAAVSYGGMVFLWDPVSGRLLRRLIEPKYGSKGLEFAHDAPIGPIVFTKDSRTVITASSDGRAKS
ncbi:MAG: hypothetical protein OEQ28_15725, partial [Acidobacteriota bacterium]|nr:hypothetical protein [Acidobacteriota bacterium]